MGILHRLTEAKTRDDHIFASRSGTYVDCWRMPGQAGVQIALFLQFHTAAGEELGGDSARVGVAVRNHYPQTFKFSRDFECRGGTLAPNSSGSLHVHPARGRPARQNLAHDGVPVERDPDADAVEVTARLTCVEPSTLGHITDNLVVSAPRGTRRRCPCCLQVFPS